MSDELVTYERKKQLIIESLIEGICVTEEDIVKSFNLTVYQVSQLMNDKSFITALSNYSKGRANFKFHTKGVSKLIEDIDSDDPKIHLPAIRILGEYSGNLKNKSGNVDIQINLENLVKESDKEKSINNPFIDIEKEG